MIEFILNSEDIRTDLPAGSTVLDFARYHKDLKGTKIGCREGDCGACTVLVGELINNRVSYRTMTSCLMPLANAAGKHIVTIEGINLDDGSLTPVQQAMVDESGTQCGFCTVGFVVSLTGFCIDDTAKTPEMAVSSVDGNICRCTGYKSIERAAARVCKRLAERSEQGETASESAPPADKPGSTVGVVDAGSLRRAIDNLIVPSYFEDIAKRLQPIVEIDHPLRQVALAQPQLFVGGGTDVYVQKPDELVEAPANHVFYNEELRGIRENGEYIEIGASATVTDLLVSPVMQAIFPNLYKHLKLVSSTPIRNMATLAGNFINASPIGDMTIWFLAMDAEIVLSSPPAEGGVAAAETDGLVVGDRILPLRDLYLGYKQLAKSHDEYITTIRFRGPAGDFRFNFEKVSKRTYLDISTVNTAISLRCTPVPGAPPAFLRDEIPGSSVRERSGPFETVFRIEKAHAAAGGVAAVPLYLEQTSAFLTGKEVNVGTISQANEIMQSEISPISDVRGTADYKRLLLRQLFTAHFYELFGADVSVART